MRKFTTTLSAASIVFAVCGCFSTSTSDGAPDGSAPIPPNEPKTEIIFKGRYFMSKECFEGPNGEWACGEWPVCRVISVEKGDLKIKYLKGVTVPAGVAEDEVHTFRWILDASDMEHLKKAQDGGNTAARIHASLEVVHPKP
jgi:hypothetical protein